MFGVLVAFFTKFAHYNMLLNQTIYWDWCTKSLKRNKNQFPLVILKNSNKSYPVCYIRILSKDHPLDRYLNSPIFKRLSLIFLPLMTSKFKKEEAI